MTRKTQIFVLALPAQSCQNGRAWKTILNHSHHQFKTRGGRMHLISRRENEGVVIGDHIYVTVLEIREDHVRMSISSPDARPSYREETLYLDRAENLCELQLQ